MAQQDVSILAVGQSNLTNFVGASYTAQSFFPLDAALDAGAMSEANVFGIVLRDLGKEGFGGYYRIFAVGGTPIEEFAPSGTQYSGVQTAETMLMSSFSRIDVVFMMVGEANASAADSQATMEGYIDDFLQGLQMFQDAGDGSTEHASGHNTVVVAVGPLEMSGVSDTDEEAIRDAYAAKAAAYSWFYYAPIDTISDDSGNHITDPTNAENCAALILPEMRSAIQSLA